MFKLKGGINESQKNKEGPKLKQSKDVIEQWTESMKSFGSKTTHMRIQPNLRRKEPMLEDELKKTNKTKMREVLVQPAELGAEQISSILEKAQKYARFT